MDPRAGSGAPDRDQLTVLLNRAALGDSEACRAVFAQSYGELWRSAEAILRRERSGRIDPAELIGELFVALQDRIGDHWESRRAFYGMASKAMRRLIVDDARRRAADRLLHGSTTDLRAVGALDAAGLLEWHEALERVARSRPRIQEVVELCCFAGLPSREAAELLGVEVRTVQRDLAAAQALIAGPR